MNHATVLDIPACGCIKYTLPTYVYDARIVDGMTECTTATEARTSHIRLLNLRRERREALRYFRPHHALLRENFPAYAQVIPMTKCDVWSQTSDYPSRIKPISPLCVDF